MSTITAILEPDADGMLRVPLPKHFHGRMRVVASMLEDEEGEEGEAQLSEEDGRMLAKKIEQLRVTSKVRREEVSPEERERRRCAAEIALRALRISNPYAEVADPVAWQRELREDRNLPGRD